MLRLLYSSLVLFALNAAAQQPPPTPKHPVTNVYHGVKVVDDYRWLENFQNPVVKQWVAEQNGYTRSILDEIRGREALAREIAQAFAANPTTYSELKTIGAKVFALKLDPKRQQPELIVFSSLADGAKEQIVFDPLKMDPTGGMEMDFYQPSLDCRYVAISLSKLGSEAGDLHIYEVATGKELAADTISHVNNGTAGGSVAWNADATGFYYTRYPHRGERPAADLSFYQQIYFHKLGTPVSSDHYEIGKDFPRIAEIQLRSSYVGKYVLATVENGDGGDYKHYIHSASGWRQITQYSDRISELKFGVDGDLYALSRNEALMGKILRLAQPEFSVQNAQTVVPESNVAIDDFVPTAHRLYVVDIAGGPSQIRIFESQRLVGMVPLEPVSSVEDAEDLGSDGLIFRTESYIRPPTWRCVSQNAMKSDPVYALSTRAPDSPEVDAEVVRDFAISKDGTRIPLNIVYPKHLKLNGSNPVLLTGYGGYDISEIPRFSPLNLVLLRHGITYVTTNLRGGGEYGEKWHEAGMLTHKQNVFDDFYACARYLVAHKYTNPGKLGIVGGSNGGLLMGAELTQHPDMYRVVLAFVGIYDMLRVELSPNGAFNVTEFGTVKELDQFKALYAYSPYHHVVDGRTYPAAIFLTGDNDPRVDPANSRKMVARLQAADHSKGPILLRTSSKAGHGIGSSLGERVAQFTDAYSFLFDQLGIQ